MRPWITAFSIALVLTSVVSGAAETLTLQQLLDRASAYELAFVEQFSNVVAEEQCLQRIVSLPSGVAAPSKSTRALKSDLLLVTYPGAAKWQAFRQVLEVDGQPVQPKDDDIRLMQLFASPAADAVERATAIAAAGTRHNLLDIGALNNPLLALAFLQPEYRGRFRFTRGGMAKELGPTVRIVRFREKEAPYVLTAAGTADSLLSSGQMWIEEASGRIVKTELQVERMVFAVGLRPGAEIVTTFRFDAELGISVPNEMRDWYPSRAKANLSGVATYSHFRRFQVHTEERVRN